MENQVEAQVRLEYGPVTVDSVGESLNVKKHQAQLRQVVKKKYPGGKPSDSLTSALFNTSAFNFEETEFEEQRVAWVPVPIGTTKAQVEAQLKTVQPRLVKILSLTPILSEEQERAMETGISNMTHEDYLERQAVRQTSTEEGVLGEKVTYRGQEQYRRIVFRDKLEADIDYRPAQYLQLEEAKKLAPQTERFSAGTMAEKVQPVAVS